MKNLLITILIIIIAITLISCKGKSTENTSASTGTYHKISAEKAKEMMDNGEVTIVDVRRPDEYKAGHIPESILVTLETIGDREPEQLPDKDATLLIYCRSGRRSREAANKLLAMGYRNVYDFGGINDWPYEITR